MNQCECHAANGVLRMPCPADAPVNRLRTLRDSSVEHLSWENLFQQLSPAEQSRLTSLAGEQGHLLCSQIPDHSISDELLRQVIERVLSRDPPDLDPLPFVDPIKRFDTELDGVQTDAVARALQSTDLLLIQGLPGTGKTRTLVELIRQAHARGDRVLLTSRSGPAVDAVLARLQAVAPIDLVRCLGKNESPSTIPTAAFHCLAVERERAVREAVLSSARGREQELDRQVRELSDVVPVWAELLAWARRRNELERERISRTEQRAAIEERVRLEVAGSSDAANTDPAIDAVRRQNLGHADWLAAWEVQSIDLRKELDRLKEEHCLALQQCDDLRRQEVAGRASHFWTVRFWKSRFNHSLPDRIRESECVVADWERKINALRAREESHRQASVDAAAAHSAEQERLIAIAVDKRRNEMDDRLAAVAEECAKIDERVRLCLDNLPAEVERPFDQSEGSIRKAEAIHAGRVQTLNESLALARKWRVFAEAEGDAIVRRWRDSVRLAAAPASALEVDPWFVRDHTPYDLVIVADAQNLNEGELTQVGRFGKRWVLFGEPPLPPPPSVPSNRHHVARSPAVRRFRSAPGVFARLWDRLYHPTWNREADRLCCRLQRVPDGDRDRLESECVADRPEVELRIWNRSSGEPRLAEVLFPLTTGIAAANEYLFRELQEIPCPSRFRTGRWESGEDAIRFRLGPASPESPPLHESILADGVSLRMSDRSDESEIVLAFRMSAGWNQTRAEAFVAQHLPVQDLGRACQLEKSHRHAPALADWLDEALFAKSSQPARLPCDGAVEFVPIPRRASGNGRHRGGAGIEIDLADPVQRSQLSPDLAALLPGHGYVNPAEARAIAELLPRLSKSHRIAVAAPYAAQMDLLRHFCPGACVTSLEHLAHTECDILVVSLTRSHVARAVTYGDHPSTILRLLPQASRRMIFVGDPGTLARRAQWEGAVDHFNEIDGERERRWVRALLSYLPTLTSISHARVPQGAQV